MGVSTHIKRVLKWYFNTLLNFVKLILKKHILDLGGDPGFYIYAILAVFLFQHLPVFVDNIILLHVVMG